MKRTEVKVGEWVVDVFEAPSGKAPTQDAALVSWLDERLRIAAIDGATPSKRTPSFGNIDGARYASAIVQSALDSDESIERAATTANTVLFETAPEMNFRFHPLAAFCAVDVMKDQLTIAGAGDCEAWIRNGEQWSCVYNGPYPSPAGRAALDDAIKGAADIEELIAIEGEVLSAPGAINSAHLGAFTEPMLTTINIEQWDEIVVASDGARLTSDRLERLEDWLTEIRDWERSGQGSGKLNSLKPHDDLTVVRVVDRG